jgi:hypothetical protein
VWPTAWPRAITLRSRIRVGAAPGERPQLARASPLSAPCQLPEGSARSAMICECAYTSAGLVSTWL